MKNIQDLIEQNRKKQKTRSCDAMIPNKRKIQAYATLCTKAKIGRQQLSHITYQHPMQNNGANCTTLCEPKSE